LKDIPVLGLLFKSTSSVKANRELVVFVTPRVVNEDYMQRDKLTLDSTIPRENTGAGF
jgi:type II secretory pathway component GspD/PulD (secretin)